jgi:hypothetical protein
MNLQLMTLEPRNLNTTFVKGKAASSLDMGVLPVLPLASTRRDVEIRGPSESAVTVH